MHFCDRTRLKIHFWSRLISFRSPRFAISCCLSLSWSIWQNGFGCNDSCKSSIQIWKIDSKKPSRRVLESRKYLSSARLPQGFCAVRGAGAKSSNVFCCCILFFNVFPLPCIRGLRYHDMSEDRVRSLLPGRDRPSTLGSIRFEFMISIKYVFRYSVFGPRVARSYEWMKRMKAGHWICTWNTVAQMQYWKMCTQHGIRRPRQR